MFKLNHLKWKHLVFVNIHKQSTSSGLDEASFDSKIKMMLDFDLMWMTRLSFIP